ncbi:MAG: hypothetical protein NTZ75_00975 [Euryarchaeota archaeon]|nr:hypothetical protein [Euryarchaeota archaeon]
MIYEDDVVNSVKSYLEKDGYKIISFCYAHQHGDDIVAEKDNKYLYVEAKGETSSKPDSNRYGKKFDSSQMRDHVAKAIYKVLELKTQHPNDDVSIAFPDNERYKKLLLNIMPSLKKMGIQIFMVDSKDNVIIF